MFGRRTNLWGFQLIAGLYLSSQERPRSTGFEGDLMILSAMMLWYSSIIISYAVVSCVKPNKSLDTKGLLSITSTRIGYFLITSGTLWRSTKSLSMKHAEAPKYNKA
jgi:heme/copper-type cytochrome/quinol oxidase subunit 3